MWRVTPKKDHFPLALLIPWNQNHFSPLPVAHFPPEIEILTSPSTQILAGMPSILSPSIPASLTCGGRAVPGALSSEPGRALCAGEPRAEQRRFCLPELLGLQCSPSNRPSSWGEDGDDDDGDDGR